MGRWAEKSYDEEVARRMRSIFDTVAQKTTEYSFGYENFVMALDQDDKFIRRVFECLVKELALRHRRSRQSTAQQHPGAQTGRSASPAQPYQLPSLREFYPPPSESRRMSLFANLLMEDLVGTRRASTADVGAEAREATASPTGMPGERTRRISGRFIRRLFNDNARQDEVGARLRDTRMWGDEESEMSIDSPSTTTELTETQASRTRRISAAEYASMLSRSETGGARANDSLPAFTWTS